MDTKNSSCGSACTVRSPSGHSTVSSVALTEADFALIFPADRSLTSFLTASPFRAAEVAEPRSPFSPQPATMSARTAGSSHPASSRTDRLVFPFILCMGFTVPFLRDCFPHVAFADAFLRHASLFAPFVPVSCPGRAIVRFLSQMRLFVRRLVPVFSFLAPRTVHFILHLSFRHAPPLSMTGR